MGLLITISCVARNLGQVLPWLHKQRRVGVRTVSFEENAPQKLIVDFRGKCVSSGCLEACDKAKAVLIVQATLASLTLIPGLGY